MKSLHRLDFLSRNTSSAMDYATHLMSKETNLSIVDEDSPQTIVQTIERTSAQRISDTKKLFLILLWQREAIE